jgi:hypothetical protein
MSTELINEKEQRFYEYFQYGQNFNYWATKFRLDRDGIFKFICRGIVEEAILKGYDVVERKSRQVIDNSHEIMRYMRKHRKHIINVAEFARGYGHGLITSQTVDGKIEFLSHAPEYYKYGYNEQNQFDQASVKTQYKDIDIGASVGARDLNSEPPVQTSKPSIWHVVDSTTARHVMPIESGIRGMGRAYINPIFDDMWALYCERESITYYVIREAGGKRIAYVPVEDLEDEDKRAEWTSILTRYNAPNSIDLIGIDTDKEKIPARVDIVGGDKGSGFGEERFVWYEVISMHTGIPVSKMKGMFQGELAAGEVTQDELFGVYETIQDTYIDDDLWMLQEVHENNEFEFTITEKDSTRTLSFEDIDIEYKTRKALTDIEKAELTKAQLENLVILQPIHKSIGMNIETVQSITGIEWEIDDSLIAEAKAEKEQMMETFNSENDEEDIDDESNRDPEEV